MKQAFEIPNYRQIKVRFIDRNGPQIKFWEPSRALTKRTKTKVVEFNTSEESDVLEFAYQRLTEAGFKIIGRASEIDAYIFFCNNWAEDLLEISAIK